MRIIAGKYKGRKLKRPSRTQTRPTTDRTRESIFNIIATLLQREGMTFEELTVLDVFAGSGALGFEALSRGAQFVAFIEKDREACDIIYENSQHLKALSKISILQGDVLYPKESDRQYDLIFLDPPYHKGLIRPALEALKHKGWVATGAIIVMEFSSDEATPNIEPAHIILERTYGSSKLLIARLS